MGMCLPHFVVLLDSLFIHSKAVLLDVRLARKYDQAHASGAVNVPLYNPISKWDIPSIIRRAGFAFFGIYGTELNRDFAAQAEVRAV